MTLDSERSILSYLFRIYRTNLSDYAHERVANIAEKNEKTYIRVEDVVFDIFGFYSITHKK